MLLYCSWKITIQRLEPVLKLSGRVIPNAFHFNDDFLDEFFCISLAQSVSIISIKLLEKFVYGFHYKLGCYCILKHGF